MLGFLIGAACLVGLVKTIRMGYGHHGFGGWHGHHARFGGCRSEAGWRGRGWSGYGGGGDWRGGPRAALRGLFERLETSPGQEKAILAALEELWAKKRAIADEFLHTRRDVGRAMRGERFDEVALGEAFTRQDALLGELRMAVSSTMKSVHEALDERQRAIVAEFFEHGFFGHHHGFGDGPPWGNAGGPYRNPAWI